MLAHIKLPYVGTNLSLRRVFVKVRRRISFFVGTELDGRSLCVIILLREGLLQQDGVICVDAAWKQWIIYLYKCTIAYEIWSLSSNIFGIKWLLLEQVIDLLFGWMNWF